jgi:hypothetical protein
MRGNRRSAGARLKGYARKRKGGKKISKGMFDHERGGKL